MKRCLWLALFVSSLGISAYAQQTQESPTKHEEAEEDKHLGWKWANFALLAVGLGYLIAKQAPAFFNSRSEDIQKAIKDATGLKVDAEFRAAESDRKMATLDAEVARIRQQAKVETERELARIEGETRVTLDKIQEHATREIESLRIQADLALRGHVVGLASDLAIARLRDEPSLLNQNELVRSFASSVAKGGVL